MEKKSFYDINLSTDSQDSIKKNVNEDSVKSTVSNTNKVSEAPRQINQGEIIMADVDTVMLSQEHADIRREVAKEAHTLSSQIGAGFCNTDTLVLERSGDIRREGAEHTNEIVKEGLKGGFETRGDIKDTRYDIASRVENAADRVVDRVEETKDALDNRFFTVGRDTQDLRAQVIAQQQQMVAGFAGVSKDTEIATLKTQVDAGKNTQYLADKIERDGEKTRSLINDLKYHDLNRGLVERNTALVNCEQSRDDWRHRYDDSRWNQQQAQFAGQWAQLQSQIQAFQSQLQETRQGMVNFGTMAGVGQSSTSNNVR